MSKLPVVVTFGNLTPIYSKLDVLLIRITKMSQLLDDLAAKVAALETVEDSAIALLEGLKAKLDAALANADLSAVQAISDKLGADTQKLAAAVAANTPA